MIGPNHPGTLAAVRTFVNSDGGNAADALPADGGADGASPDVGTAASGPADADVDGAG